MAAKSIYTDGCCKGNPGIGGWGFAVFHGCSHEDQEPEFTSWGGDMQTTNNRMELLAIIQALTWTLSSSAFASPTKFSPAQTLHLFTDSTYCKNGCTTWLDNWKKNNWKKADGSLVLNQELWQQLDFLMSKWHSQREGNVLHFHWVKGHAQDAGNELADRLSNKFVNVHRPQEDLHEKKRGAKASVTKKLKTKGIKRPAPHCEDPDIE